MMRLGSLCTGYGGLDHAVGGELVWVSDVDRGASTLLAHRYPDVPNVGDLTTANWDDWPRIDVITAGWPCQPWSSAGNRKGMADERAIWPGIARAVRMVRPRYVVLENVSAVVGMGELGRAVGDLAALGYDAGWVCVRASDVGAPHRRERCFIAARDTDLPRADAHSEGRGPRHPAGEPSRAPRDTAEPRPQGPPGGRLQRGQPRPAGSAARDAEIIAGTQRRNDGECPQAGGTTRLRTTGGADSAATDADGGRSGSPRTTEDQTGKPGPSQRGGTSWGAYEPAIRRWERVLGRPAPAPLDDGRLSPRFVEWLMGLPDGWVCDVPGLSRTAQLKLLGNGVVPQQAQYALRLLGGAP